MTEREPLEQDHRAAARGERSRGRRPHHAAAHDHHVRSLHDVAERTGSLASALGPGETRSRDASPRARPLQTTTADPTDDPRRRGERRWPPMSYWVRVLLTIAAVSAVLIALWSVINIVILVLMAAVLAIGLDPAVRSSSDAAGPGPRGGADLPGGPRRRDPLRVAGDPAARDAGGGARATTSPGTSRSSSERDDAIGRYVRENDVADRLQRFVERLPETITRSFGTIVGVAGQGRERDLQRRHGRDPHDLLHALPAADAKDARRSGSRPETRDRAEDVMDQSINRIGGYVAGILTTASIAGSLRAAVLHDPRSVRRRDPVRGSARGLRRRSPG